MEFSRRYNSKHNTQRAKYYLFSNDVMRENNVGKLDL